MKIIYRFDLKKLNNQLTFPCIKVQSTLQRMIKEYKERSCQTHSTLPQQFCLKSIQAHCWNNIKPSQNIHKRQLETLWRIPFFNHQIPKRSRIGKNIISINNRRRQCQELSHLKQIIYQMSIWITFPLYVGMEQLWGVNMPLHLVFLILRLAD